MKRGPSCCATARQALAFVAQSANGEAMASNEQEGRFLDEMLSDLAWSGRDVLPGDEPPDFFL